MKAPHATHTCIFSVTGLAALGLAACSQGGDESGGADPNGTGTGGAALEGTGGTSLPGTGGADDTPTGGSEGVSTGGQSGSGGANTGGVSSGAGGEVSGAGGMDAGSGGESASGGFTGTCTASEENDTASGSGPYGVVIETNGDPGINEGTIYRPDELGGDEKFPIFVWGNGGCSLNGTSNRSAMVEIASHGYVVVADGTPGSDGERNSSGDPLLVYAEWLISENEKPCSAFYQSMQINKIAANGFSCGGLMATDTSADPRITTWGHTCSGLFNANNSVYDAVHTPVLILAGSNDELALENGRRDYNEISSRKDVPIMFFEKAGVGHGGDLFSPGGGEFTEILLAWNNWWLKGDEGATGKGALVGASCSYCSDSSWDILSAHIP